MAIGFPLVDPADKAYRNNTNHFCVPGIPLIATLKVSIPTHAVGSYICHHYWRYMYVNQMVWCKYICA